MEHLSCASPCDGNWDKKMKTVSVLKKLTIQLDRGNATDSDMLC